MAVGTGIGFDLDALSKAIERADKGLDILLTKSDSFSKKMIKTFLDIGTNGIDPFLSKLKEQKAGLEMLANMNTEGASKGMKELAYESKLALDRVNDVINAFGKLAYVQENRGAKNAGMQYAKEFEDKTRFYERWINETYLKEQERTQQEAQQANERAKNSSASYQKELREKERFYLDWINKTFEADEKRRKKEEDAERKKNERLYAERAKLHREANKKQNQTYDGAIAFSKTAKTLAREIQAVKNLEEARAKLNKTSADYDKKLANINNRIKKHNENIDKATKGAKTLREEHQSLGQAAGGLGRMLASAFSIQAIRGYINQMIKVRGEFELQQRSLQAILQNKDAADELWQKTIDLAVRSPFRVKELVTYTKQLAAYRIESDKLFETNKMLADVSAGLGVDMSRLILAFGQVRSASFLRGTELRQFTEAGIPMLEELAKYFTELEGRAVSVGDVFERISKRMVSFADVEEVFKRITSEGGTFYRMQEIQAETLRGQISNLKDSIDIMLNDMGKSYDSTLKNMVSLTKSLVDNWRTVSSIAIPIVGALVARWGIFKIATTKNAEAIAGFAKTFGRHFGVVITQLTRGTRVAKQFAKATQVSIMGGWTTVILAVVAALTILVKTIQNANRVKRELEKIDLSGAFDASRSVAEYKRLANVVSDTSKSYDEQQKALSTLKAKYQDILPSHLLEQDTIKALKGNYEEATTAIYEYIAAKTKEKQIEVIQTEYGSDVAEQAGDLADDIKKALAKVAPNITRADVLPIVNKLQELIQLGDVSVLNVDEVIQNLVRQFTGLEISADAWKYTFSATNGEMVTLENNAESLVIAMGKMKRAMNEVTSSSLSWQDSFIYQDFNRVKEGYEEQSTAIGKYYETIRKYEQEREEKGESEVADELKRDYETAVESLNKIFDEANQKAPEWSAIINEPFKLNEATINANKILWQKMIGEINTMPIVPNQVGAKQNYVELLEEQMEGFAGTKKQQEVARVAQDLANTMRVSLEGLDELFLKSDESLSDYAKRISGTLEQYKKGILQFDTDIQNGTKFGDYTKDQVDLMRSQVPFLEEFLKLFAAFLEPKKSTTTEDTFTPMLRSVKEIYSEFKKLQGSFDDLTAKEGALAKFGDAFKEAFGKTPEQMGFDLFSEEGVKAAYDYLISKAPDAKKKIQAQLAKGEIVWDVKLQKKKDTDQELVDSVQELFDQYDLSLELKKLNIPSDLAKSLFNVDYLDLDGLRREVQSQGIKFIGTDMEDEYRTFLEKIDDMEDKAAKERMKNYVKYLQEGMSERVKLKIEELRKLKEIEESAEFTPEQKERIKAGVSREAKKAQDKQEWEDFKGSEMYTMMFEDLELFGSKALDVLKKKLEELKGSLKDLDPSEVKEIVSQINKIESIAIARNPFASLRDAMKEVRELEKQGKSEETLQETFAKAEANKKAYQDELNAIELILNANGNLLLLQSQSEEWQKEYGHYLGMQTDELENQRIAYQSLATGQGFVATNAKNDLQVYIDARQALKAVSDEWGSMNSLASKAWDSAKTIMESLGVESDSLAMTIGDTAMSMVDLIFQGVQFYAQLQLMSAQAKILNTEMNAALGPIGWVALALQAVATLLSAIFSAKDKALQKEIDGHLARAEKLHEKYEELSDAIDSAYDASVVRQLNKEIEKTIQLEIKAIEAAIAAEKSQKDSKIDWGWVDEQEKKVKELYNTLNEEHDNYIERWGGFGSDEARFDFIESMTQAWLDSFKETGEGLAGLEEKWDEYFDNLAMKQMALRVSKAAIDEYLDMWDKYVSAESAGGEDLTEAEAQDLRLKKEQLLKSLSEKYTSLTESLGITPTTEGGGLSALTKGISGMSEQQADILAAYWNSVRGYTASIDSKMDLILANMGVGAENNPMLEQLISQTSWLSKIHGILEDVASASPRTFKTSLT